MITTYNNSIAKRTRGCNTKARTSVIKYIYAKIKASKEEGRYKQEVTVLGGIEYIHISLTEIIEVAGYRDVKFPKQYARNLLKNIIRNGVIKEYDTGEKITGCRYTKKIYGIADINILMELEDGKEKLTQKYLYPTRCRIALEATEYFMGEAKRQGCCSQEINSPRFFKRIGRILKDFFFNDLEKFKAWVRYIYDHGKKNTYMLLRNNAEVLRLFVLGTFKKIYEKYEMGFKMSGYWWDDQEAREAVVVGEGESNKEIRNNYHWKYSYKGGEEKDEEKQPEAVEIEYPRGATKEMCRAFQEIYRQMGKKEYKTYVLDSLIIEEGDTIISITNDFHWRISGILDLYGIKYKFTEMDKNNSSEADNKALAYYLSLG